MAQRWIVYSREKTLGPWHASEVREQLRSGSIDPFDMVSADGSQLKRPLVEVDEIFQTSRVQLAEIVMEPKSVVGGEAPESTVISQKATMIDDPTPPQAPPPEPDRPRQFQALAAEARVVSPKGGGKGSPNPKMYLVFDSNGLTLGPLGAMDIVDLWNRGGVDARAIVQRKDQPRKVPIDKFVSLYNRGGDRPTGVKLSPKVATYRDASLLPKLSPGVAFVVFSLVAVILLLGIQLWKGRERDIHSIVNKKQRPSNSPTSVQPLENIRSQRSAPEVLNLTAEPILVSPTVAVRNKDSDLLPASKQSVPKESTAKSKQDGQLAKSKVKKAQTKKSAPTASSDTSRRSQANPETTRSSVQVKQAKKVGRKVVVDTPKNSRQASPLPSIAAPRPPLVDGSQATLLGYRYSLRDVDKCEIKCKITINGPAGPVTAVFFKEAFGSVLKNKNGRASFSGLVRKPDGGGTQIIINQVK
jgi:hypothetical protein